jgi:hypothetical protein
MNPSDRIDDLYQHIDNNPTESWSQTVHRFIKTFQDELKINLRGDQSRKSKWEQANFKRIENVTAAMEN